MKNTFIKNFLFYISFVFSLFFTGDANAWIFFGNEKKDLLKKADSTYDLAIKANEEGNANDSIVLFSDARGQYSSILNTYPEYETEHVTERLNICAQQMQIIKDKIVSGEIAVPPIEPVVADAGSSTPTATPMHIEKPTEESNGAVVEKSNSNMPEESKPSTNSTETAATSYAYSSNNPLANGNEATRIMLINSMLDSNKTTDVIFYIDEIIEAEGDNTPLSIRCLYVKALISVGNKSMADLQLNILKKQAPNDPAVRLLASALAVAKGDAMDAMLQLDKLIEENPSYAEARINYAYLLLMMDPKTYRDAAIDSYISALKLGAKRDPNLETNLNIIMK